MLLLCIRNAMQKACMNSVVTLYYCSFCILFTSLTVYACTYAERTKGCAVASILSCDANKHFSASKQFHKFTHLHTRLNVYPHSLLPIRVRVCLCQYLHTGHLCVYIPAGLCRIDWARASMSMQPGED